MPTSTLFTIPADFVSNMVAGAGLIVSDLGVPLAIVAGAILGVAILGIIISLMKKVPKGVGK